MVKFLFCLKMPTLLTVELGFRGNFLGFQNLTMVKFWKYREVSAHFEPSEVKQSKTQAVRGERGFVAGSVLFRT